MTSRLRSGRRAGMVLPLFSCPSTASWGIGDIGDVAPTTAWLAKAGQSVLQLLPLNEMASGEQSPYSALTAMALDPIFISLGAVPEFAALGGEVSLSEADRETLDEVRRAPQVAYPAVRRLKNAALRSSFERFLEVEWRLETARACEFQAFVAAQAWWIEDYSLFRALHAREKNRSWLQWDEALRRREPAALTEARRELWREVLFYQYLQWMADVQWKAAREAASANGVALFGDLPFMVDGDSADVWTNQDQFRLDASTGVPPDAFSATGQDWGMPVYRWDVIAATDFRWLRARVRRSADLFDGYRVDHLVGFYRTYGRPRDGGEPFFIPPHEPDQLTLGERVMGVFRERGSEIIAEDLGTVPEFVRESLARLGVPGLKVFRWERLWHTEGHPFREPGDYPTVSVATSGTHDTETLAAWWDTVDVDERGRLSSLPTIQQLTGGRGLGPEWNAANRDTLLEALFASQSDLILTPTQDVFGWRDRINEPATVNSHNWTFKLPWPVDRLDDQPEAEERRMTLRRWAERYGRW